MTAKRIWVICVLVLLLCSCICAILPVSAETGWTAEMRIEGVEENTEEGTLTVRVSVEQITCQSGIFGALYNIHYDNSILELISWENAKPTGWVFSGADPDAVDFTRLKQATTGKNENYLDFQLANTALTGGVKKNGELYTNLYFKVLSDTAESVEITVTDIRLVDVKMDQCKLPNQKCMIGLQGKEDSPVEPIESEASDDEPSEDSNASESTEAPDSSEAPETPEDPIASETTTGETDPTGTSRPSSEEAPPASDSITGQPSKTVCMWIMVEDITDPAGVSSLSFTLKYNTSFLQYVSYECLLPNDWDLQTEYTEDLTRTSNGSIDFWIMNHDAGHGVKEGGVLGVFVEFKFAGTDFDPSLLTIEKTQLINDEISEMSVDSYRLSTRYEYNGEAIFDDIFTSNENKGSALQIWIVVISVVLVIAAAITTFLIMRKKKLA